MQNFNLKDENEKYDELLDLYSRLRDQLVFCEKWIQRALDTFQEIQEVLMDMREKDHE